MLREHYAFDSVSSDTVAVSQLLEFENLMNLQKNKLTGSFFTPEIVGRQLSKNLVNCIKKESRPILQFSICDPFAGDGRLLNWLIEELAAAKIHPKLYVEAWDLNPSYIEQAKKTICATCRQFDFDFELKTVIGDTFISAKDHTPLFDVVITNPPWFVLKPDTRHMQNLSQREKDEYVNYIKHYSKRLGELYTYSIPKKTWAGWNVNLARVGTEVALLLLKESGLCGIVSPDSLMADSRSSTLRKLLLQDYCLLHISHYPAESKIFNGVDQGFITAIFSREGVDNTHLVGYDQSLNRISDFNLKLTKKFLSTIGWRVPLKYNERQLDILQKIMRNTPFEEFSKYVENEVWVGRELDETRFHEKIAPNGSIPFVKGRDITSGSMDYSHSGLMDKKKVGRVFDSMKYYRLVWRDVSRQSQKRRIQTAILPPGPMLGNSLNVLHCYSMDPKRIFPIYGIVSSLVFEFQARALLSTNHVSSGVIKLCKIPLYSIQFSQTLSNYVDQYFDGNAQATYSINVLVAKAYGLSFDEYCSVIESFKKLTEKERGGYLDEGLWNSIEIDKR